MRLRRAVRFLDKAEMDVVVSDDKGNLSKINHTWKTKDKTEAPIPELWFKTTEMEFRTRQVPESGPTDINQITER